MTIPKLISCALALSTILATATSANAAEPVELKNGGFETGLAPWLLRAPSTIEPQILSPGYQGQNFARLEVGAAASERDREAVYLIRRDLPTEAGNYQIRFAARSSLTQGRGGARIVNLDADNKVLSSFVPGGKIPLVQGQTPWTEYSFVYTVPPATKLSVLQLDGNALLGTLDYDAISIEKLTDEEAKNIPEVKPKPAVFAPPPFVAVPPRAPQFPLKTKRMIASDADVATARANIEKYPEAKQVLEAIQKIADPWLEWSDDDLRTLMPSAQVPRAFDLNAKGCPLHGDEVFKKGGAYPWILDPRHPFQVTCPVGGETYPSNDFAAYANGDFKAKPAAGEYADDGWGWLAPDGERYWFVAYANQWTYYRTVEPALLNLSRAYLLTGDKRYAHKAAVMLHRLAEVYPSMDYENQSRYGLMSKATGSSYKGKVLNHIWECFFARDFAEAYDNVWDSIDGDAELQKSSGKTGAQLRGFIEANLLEDAIDAYDSTQIQGNFGMHQTALLYNLLARQNVDLKKYVHILVDDPGADVPHTGLRYALYNQVWRDGMPFESPGYNSLWIENFAVLSELLKKGGTDLYGDPKLKLLFDSPLNIVNIGRYTPSIGDSGGARGGLVGRSAQTYSRVQDAYHDPRYAAWLDGASETDNRGFSTFETLFEAPLAPKTESKSERVLPAQASRIFAGYGLGILNNPADTVGLTLTYGFHVSHFHWDFLNFELFANGQPMMPDLGYPDAMNAYVSSIYTWSQNTIAHNTVVVDAHKQDNNRPGILHQFADSPFARSVDASSPAYDKAQTYRRNLIQVDADAAHSYVVDVFRVAGGTQHDYSLHGPPGESETIGGKWSDPAPGTLAGADVKLGEIYDDKTLAAPDYAGSYAGYRGSGFQHLFNVRTRQSGDGEIQFQHVADANAKLRIHPLTQGAQQLFLADAWDLPRGRKNQVKYLITRRQSADGQPLQSTFISVLEPFDKAPFIQSTSVLKLDGGEGVAVKVERAGATDIVLSDPQATTKTLAQFGLETDAQSAVVTFDAAKVAQRVFFSGGTYLKVGAQTYKAAPLRAKVGAVDAMAQTVSVDLPANATFDVAALSGRTAHFSNDLGQTVHPIASATRAGNVLTLKTADAILVGRARADDVTGATVATSTVLPLASTYAGTTLLDSDFAPLARVRSAGIGAIALAAPPQKTVAPSSDVWFSNVGAGDEVEFPALFYWTK